MNGINDDIYIIYIYNNGKEPPHSKRLYCVMKARLQKIKGYRERRSGCQLQPDSAGPVVENFKDSEYNRNSKIYHRIGYFYVKWRNTVGVWRLNPHIRNPTACYLCARKDSIINFGFSGTDNNYYNGLIKLYQDILIDKSGVFADEKRTCLWIRRTVITQFCYLRT
jgi:hypothetical protein